MYIVYLSRSTYTGEMIYVLVGREGTTWLLHSRADTEQVASRVDGRNAPSIQSNNVAIILAVLCVCVSVYLLYKSRSRISRRGTQLISNHRADLVNFHYATSRSPMCRL